MLLNILQKQNDLSMLLRLQEAAGNAYTLSTDANSVTAGTGLRVNVFSSDHGPSVAPSLLSKLCGTSYLSDFS